MKRTAIILSVPALLLLAAIAAQATETELGLRNKRSNILQLDCEKNNDSKKQFAYVCYDSDDGSETYINQGGDWEIVSHEKVCFRHQDDRIQKILL